MDISEEDFPGIFCSFKKYHQLSDRKSVFDSNDTVPSSVINLSFADRENKQAIFTALCSPSLMIPLAVESEESLAKIKFDLMKKFCQKLN